MSPAELVKFVSYGEAPEGFDPARAGDYQFGDETDHPLSREQMLYLKYRYGVYFPWKVCYHLLENDRWDDKHSGEGKSWNEDARLHFPKTIALIEQLPFREIGRVVIFGILPNDHAPLHRDSEPGKDLSIAQFITIDPRQNKGLYLQNAAEDEKVVVDASAYWFNDMDYHGVLSAPHFRYSIRIDGVFEPSFVRDLERRHRGSRAAPIPSSA